MRLLTDYLEPSRVQVRAQLRQIVSRQPVSPGLRQAPFLPVETLLCAAAAATVDHTRFGSKTAASAPAPVPQLAQLFRRPPSSVLAKMANLDGSRPHGARWDEEVGATLRADPDLRHRIYRLILGEARDLGISQEQLPDFL